MLKKNNTIVSEEDFKEKLNIRNWNELSKEKFINFVKISQSTDPKIVKQALAQFPNFVQMVLELTSDIKDIGDKAISEGDKSYVAFVEQCNQLINTLQKKINRRFISYRKEKMYLDEINRLMEILDKKEEEHKHWLLKIVNNVKDVAFCSVAIASLILGLRVTFLNNSDDNQE